MRIRPVEAAGTSRRTLVVALVAATVALLLVGEDAREPGGPLPVDQRTMDWLARHRGEGWVDLARVVSHLGDPVSLVSLALAAGIWLWMRRSPLEAIVPAAALLAASTTEAVAKAIIGRPRPAAILHLVPEADASFPSGHTTGSAALFVAAALVLSMVTPAPARRALVVGLAGMVAAAVGASRLVLGVHWLTDVVAGLLLGTAWAVGLVLALESVRTQVPTRRTPHRTTSGPVRGAPARTS